MTRTSLLVLAGLTSVPGALAQDTLRVQSQALDEEREVFVHLPRAYHWSDRRFPVLYVLDAEWVFPFAVGAVDFLAGEVGARIPASIVVGIRNTDRDRDLRWRPDGSGNLDGFMDFVEHEAIPLIDSLYRTHPHRVVYGWSSASNVPLWMLFTRPQAFSGYIASGSGIGPRGGEVAAAELRRGDFAGRRLFVSTEGTTPVRVEGLRRLVRILEETGPAGLEWEWRILEGQDHASVLATGLYQGLESIFSAYLLPRDVAARGPQATRDYYRRLSDVYGFPVGTPEYAVSETANQMLYGGQVEEAIELFELITEEHESSPVAHALLAEGYEAAGDLARARQQLETAVALARSQADQRLHAWQARLDALSETPNRNDAE